MGERQGAWVGFPAQLLTLQFGAGEVLAIAGSA